MCLPLTRDNIDEGLDDTNIPTYRKLEQIRELVFAQSGPSIVQKARDSRQTTISTPQPQPQPTTPAPQNVFDFETPPKEFLGNGNNFPDLPSVPTTSPNIDSRTEIAAPRQIPRGDLDMMVEPITPSQQAAQRIAALDTELRREQPATGSRRLVIASPRIVTEIDQPPSVVVNQEILHKVRVSNMGDALAERVSVKTEIPSWIDFQTPEITRGNVELRKREDGSGITDLEWKMNGINPDVTETLFLRTISRLDREIEFHFETNYHRPAIIAKVEVQKPKLELELIGPDEMLWNDVAAYKLVVHNVGNGDAENIKLELLQTSAGDKDSVIPILKPRESQLLDIVIQATGEQDRIDLAVVATGAHDLRGEIKRQIRVLRPKLDMTVHTIPLHFVENLAEVTIRIRNTGTADADYVAIEAQLPLGARYASSTEGGVNLLHNQENVVQWRGKSIARNEIQTFTLICVPQREGECRVSVEAREANGVMLATSYGTFMAEAVVDLDLAVISPKGPIELGQTVMYEIEVTNTGTKAAENVTISFALGPQLKPSGVGGLPAEEENGQVFFEKIPAIIPKETVKVSVRVEAERTGTAPIRAEVVAVDTSGVPLRLGKELSVNIFNRRVAMGQSNEVIR